MEPNLAPADVPDSACMHRPKLLYIVCSQEAMNNGGTTAACGMRWYVCGWSAIRSCTYSIPIRVCMDAHIGTFRGQSESCKGKSMTSSHKRVYADKPEDDELVMRVILMLSLRMLMAILLNMDNRGDEV